jgi:hypothetical protein
LFGWFHCAPLRVTVAGRNILPSIFSGKAASEQGPLPYFRIPPPLVNNLLYACGGWTAIGRTKNMNGESLLGFVVPNFIMILLLWC